MPQTLIRLLSTAARLLLRRRRAPVQRPLPELPTFCGGGALVDIDDREALYEVLDPR